MIAGAKIFEISIDTFASIALFRFALLEHCRKHDLGYQTEMRPVRYDDKNVRLNRRAIDQKKKVV